jgi:hypothetical protein
MCKCNAPRFKPGYICKTTVSEQYALSIRCRHLPSIGLLMLPIEQINNAATLAIDYLAKCRILAAYPADIE